MQENAKYAVGIDIGSTMVRCVVGHVDMTSGNPTIVGVGKALNTGMRKGVVSNLNGPAAAIDEALGEAERMSGYQVDVATVSINGTHLLSTKADGMIAVGSIDHAVTREDVRRIEDVATMGKIPANREIIEIVPHSFRLDGQDNIKDPIGMSGTRLEINANVISALGPYLHNVEKTAAMAKVNAHAIVPSVLASAKAVLKESQIENGVAVVDMGGTTTSVAVFEEGDLQHVGVIAMGGANITNDLAIGLKTDPEIAEKVKCTHADAIGHLNSDSVSIKEEKETFSFSTSDIDEIVEARLEEIFEAVNKELKKVGRAGKLPSGVVLVGGTANIKHIAEFAKKSLNLAARVGKSSGYGGVSDEAAKPEFAAAIGLMMIDSDQGQGVQKNGTNASKYSGAAAKDGIKKASGMMSKLLDKFKI